jgi:hypothetical protein
MERPIQHHRSCLGLPTIRMAALCEISASATHPVYAFLAASATKDRHHGVFPRGTRHYWRQTRLKTVGRGRFLNVTVACVNNTSVDVRSVSIKLIQEISKTIDFAKHYEKVTLVDMKVADYSGMVASRPKENLYSEYAARPTLPASNVQSDSQHIHDALASGNKNYVPMKIPAVSDLQCVELQITHESLCQCIFHP